MQAFAQRLHDNGVIESSPDNLSREDAIVVMEEAVANLSEKRAAKHKLDAREQSLWKRFVNAVKAAMNKMLGLEGKKELRYDTVEELLDSLESMMFEGGIIDSNGEKLTPENQRKNNLLQVIMHQIGWHGSPFNFDQFLLDHVGGGEGRRSTAGGCILPGTGRRAKDTGKG